MNTNTQTSAPKKDARSLLASSVAQLAHVFGGITGKKLLEVTTGYLQKRRAIYEKYHQEDIALAKKFKEKLMKMKLSSSKENQEQRLTEQDAEKILGIL